ncbi:MAG TPA: hypothetical protein PLC52_01255 [Anaerolineales bacterium]|nr:hypothetical protein [Anaerolineales bacterium]HRQ91479.1 hypothetical protein [Anaerolineales bacterium]
MRGSERNPALSNTLGKFNWGPALILALLFALGVAIRAVAAYLGPDRGYTVEVIEEEFVFDPSKDAWLMTSSSGATCTIMHSCSEHPSTTRQQDLCGWEAVNSHCTLGTSIIQTIRHETHFHPEASVSSSVQCAQDGNGGWCIGAGALVLGAHEPLASYSILGIEGSLDGDPFFCVSTACNLPGSPGVSSASFWAISSYGDTSQMGSATLSIDDDFPSIVGLVSGLQGKSGWYVGNITLSAVGADATSGLAAQQVQVNGDGWQNNSATISSDGVHTAVFRAEDVAGLESLTSPQELRRDTAPPSISVDAFDAPARGMASVSGSMSDATSGPGVVHFSVAGGQNQTVPAAGGSWQLEWDSTQLPNGEYVFSVQAEDQAGILSALQEFAVRVDNVLPFINLPGACWPIWQVLDLDAGPGTAPISLVSLTVRGGGLSHVETFTTPPLGWTWNRTFSDGSVAQIGEYVLEVYVEDSTGNANSRRWLGLQQYSARSSVLRLQRLSSLVQG